jgi:glucose/arabinose dehydrogenase
MKTLLALSAVVLASLTLGAAAAQAASLQPVGSFVQPIYVTSDPDNPDRLFVVERQGTIEEVRNETVRMFADLSSVVEAGALERGLLSIALAPSFDTTGLLYVDYTGREEPGEIHVAELRAFGGSAPLSTLRNLLTIPHPGQSNHNGGQLQFGPEGDLYVSTGDGGGSNDVLHNAQDLTTLLGKILRIDPSPLGLLPYTVPAGNPFPAATPPNDTIWSYGLRNPFRFSFDRLTGAIVIGDVGQSKREEVDYAAPGLGGGADYGWNCREGRILGPATDPCATPPPGGFVEPVFDYPHIDPGSGAAHGCAIIGGYVVRDESLGSLYGRYLYGDLCTGELRSLSFSNPFTSDRFEGLHVDNLNSFGEDSCGRLYTVSGDGVVARLVGPTPTVCRPVLQVSSTRRPALVGLRAVRRRVERHRRALLTAWASPCEGRRGERVKLLRGRTVIASKPLSRACTAHFSPRIGRPTAFRATIAEDTVYLAATSRRLMIKIQRRHRR